MLLALALLGKGACSALAAKYSLEGRENFKITDLPPETQVWHNRVLEGFKYTAYDPKAFPSNPNEWSSSGDVYHVGRSLNVYGTGLLTMLRVTGDLRILDELDRLMQRARGQLRDRWDNGKTDGYLNWRNYFSASQTDPTLRGTDLRRELDEILAHSFTAAVAYAFKVNENKVSPKGIPYKERATFWTHYLKNHFETKWRKRNGKNATEFPFMYKHLMHIYSNFVRYHYYMHKLTGNAAYLKEATRLASVVDKNMIDIKTSKGVAYIWQHGVTFDMWRDTKVGNTQMTVYLLKTYAAIMDLHCEGFAQFGSDSVMKSYMMPMRDFVLDGQSTSLPLARCIGGEITRTGIRHGDGLKISPRPTFGSDHNYVRKNIHIWTVGPFGMLALWDDTSKVRDFTVKAHNASNAGYLNKPKKAGSAISMVFYTRIKNGYSPSPTPPPTLGTPSTPTQLIAQAISSSQIKVTWKDNSTVETGYKIERSTDGGKTFTQLTTTGANITSFTNSSLMAGKTYHYRIRAYNSSGNSGYSNIASSTTQLVLLKPGAPSNLVASAVSPTQIELRWSDNSQVEAGYQLERSINGGALFTLLKTLSANTTSHSDLTVSQGTTYHYRVRAVNASGSSAYSSVASVTTPPANEPPTPPVTSASLNGETAAFVKWTVSTDADGIAKYVLYRDGAEITISTDLQHLDRNLTPGTTYNYSVKAIDSKGLASSESNKVTVTIPKPAPSILMVVGSTTLNLGDAAIHQRLTSKGYKVAVLDDDLIASANPFASDLILISSTVVSMKVGTKFRDAATPVLCWESYLFDDLGMTGPVAGVDYNWQENHSKIFVSGTSSSIAKNATGSQVVFTTSQPMSSAKPVTGAHIVATVDGTASTACIFTYRQGTTMGSGVAPASRVGFFLGNDGAALLTPPGWILFDQAVEWALN
jgi:fibronectin type 3 domain-containing protein